MPAHVKPFRIQFACHSFLFFSHFISLFFLLLSRCQDNRKIYKSSRYEYSSSSSGRDAGIVPQPKSYESVEPTNINQLDNLLDDLKQERVYSYDRGKPQQQQVKRFTLSLLKIIRIFCSIL